LNALSDKNPSGCWLVQPTNQMTDISVYASADRGRSIIQVSNTHKSKRFTISGFTDFFIECIQALM
jgi:hypothetical protein